MKVGTLVRWRSQTSVREHEWIKDHLDDLGIVVYTPEGGVPGSDYYAIRWLAG